MFHLLGLMAQSSVTTVAWNPYTSLIMIGCNIFAIVIGRYAIQKPGQGPPFPVAQAEFAENFGFPELLATMSFGHILGAGMILGLTQAGLL